MLHLIVYDISSDRIRNKVAETLMEASFERLQLSVFLGLDNPQNNRRLWNKLNELLSAEPQAKFYVIPLPKSSIKNMVSIGENKLDIDYLTGDKDSLFI